MAKIKYVKKKEKNTTLWMSIFIMIIMVFSIIGFAMMSGGKSGGIAGGSSQPDEMPLRKIEQDGQIFWAAIKNGELFVFDDIDQYMYNPTQEELANLIKQQKSVSLYVEDNFSTEAEFLIEKALRGLKIQYTQIFVFDNEPNTLLLTNNVSKTGAFIFAYVNEDAISKAEELVYYLVR